MTLKNLPEDINACTLLNYVGRHNVDIELCGTHRRNAYKEIGEIENQDQKCIIHISRNGMYDILPEALFHPIDRYDNIRANEYAEKLEDEYRKQQQEEADARNFFHGADVYMFGLACQLDYVKNLYSSTDIITDLILDHIPEKYVNNRFINATRPFIPGIRNIRGDIALITMMLRKVFFDEGLHLQLDNATNSLVDKYPRYNCQIDSDDDETFLGNEYYDSVITYRIDFWDNDLCDKNFLKTVDEIYTYQDFLNRYFVGVEQELKMNISTDTLPVRLSDDLYYNYLGYNTNL